MKSPEPLSGAAIDRILDRVHEAPGGGSLDLASTDRNALRDDLHWEVALQLMSDAAMRVEVVHFAFGPKSAERRFHP